MADLNTPELIGRLNEAARGKTQLVHMMMHYGCLDCQSIKPIYLGYGVAGPDEVSDIAIACPFGGPPCDICNGHTQHVAWNRDQSFEPRIPPPGAYVWCLPSGGLPLDTEFSSMYAGTHFIAGR